VLLLGSLWKVGWMALQYTPQPVSVRHASHSTSSHLLWSHCFKGHSGGPSRRLLSGAGLWQSQGTLNGHGKVWIRINHPGGAAAAHVMLPLPIHPRPSRSALCRHAESLSSGQRQTSRAKAPVQIAQEHGLA
jgi:hypothetical protein